MRTAAANARTVLGVTVSTLAIGGAEQLLLELLRRLDRDRFDPRLYCLRDPGPIGREIADLGVPVTHSLGGGPVRSVYRLRRAFLADGVDAALFINHRNCLFYGTAAARWAGVPVAVNWQNETYKRHSHHALYMLARRGVVWSLDALAAASRGHAGYLVEVEKVPVRKVLAIPNAVDVDAFRSGLSPHEARRRLGLPVDGKIAGILASLRPDKAHDVFLPAAARGAAPDAAAHFVIVGDGPQRPMLEEMAARLGLAGRAVFLGFRRDVPDVLAALDMVVLSSHPQQETLSVAALEAMAAGLPVVCTRVGFMDEIVIDGVTGRLTPPGDPAALAAAMAGLFADDAARREMGRRACALVRHSHSLDGMTRRFEDLFTELSAGNPPRANLCPLAQRRVSLGLYWAEKGQWRLLHLLRRDLAAVEYVRLGDGVRSVLSGLGARLGNAAAWAAAGLLAIKMFRRAWRSDVVLSWALPLGVCMGLLLRLVPARRRPTHVLRDFHINRTRTDAAYRLRLAVLRLALPGIDALWCTSQAEQKAYADMLGLPIAAVSFYPDEPPSQYLDMPDIPCQGYVFAYGNSDRDFASLLDAAGVLGREIVILSQTFDPAGPLPHSVRLIRERVSEEEMVRLIQAAAVVVVPTKDRSLAAGQNGLLESMALGRPVVAAANVAVLEYADHGEEALFYEPGDREGLVQALGRVLDDPEAAREMGRRGRERCRRMLEEQPYRFLALVSKAIRLSGRT
jgi:glycosyltransferase involved in cell wall biosynthesis